MTRGTDPMRRTISAAIAAATLFAAPSYAYAAYDSPAHEPVVWVISIASLLASVALLLVALGLARVSQGSAIAENISYVVAACVCLAGSALADWAVRFAPQDVAAAQVELGGKALTVMSIVFFCIYFFRVRAAMRRFLGAASAVDDLPRAQFPEPEPPGVAETSTPPLRNRREGDRTDG
jgi:drug/metabolite transporter (DMT)-like permease